MDLQVIVDGFLGALKSNLPQILIALITLGGVMLTSLLTRRSTAETNQLGRDRFEHEKNEKLRESEANAKKREREEDANESKKLFDRQEQLYENTHRLIATLERRLETQAKESHEERVILKREITGLRRTVVRLERRVSQLVTAFRTLGHEPPPEETVEDADPEDDKRKNDV